MNAGPSIRGSSTKRTNSRAYRSRTESLAVG